MSLIPPSRISDRADEAIRNNSSVNPFYRTRLAKSKEGICSLNECENNRTGIIYLDFQDRNLERLEILAFLKTARAYVVNTQEVCLNCSRNASPRRSLSLCSNSR